MAVPGDFMECGVYRGDMTWMITEMVDLRRANKKFYIYDTFTGLAPQYSSAADFPGAPQYLRASTRTIGLRISKATCAIVFAARTTLSSPRAWCRTFSVTSRRNGSHFSLDLNSPRAETAALEFLLDRVAPGGIIIFDDYGWKHFQNHEGGLGPRFMAERGQVIIELPTGQGLMIKR